jgi:hypothetical protein
LLNLHEDLTSLSAGGGRGHFAEGAGLLLSEIEVGRVSPTETIPDGLFWTPEGPGDRSTFWQTSGAAGRSIYLTRRAAL